jgi:hypothetical protein
MNRERDSDPLNGSQQDGVNSADLGRERGGNRHWHDDVAFVPMVVDAEGAPHLHCLSGHGLPLDEALREQDRSNASRERCKLENLDRLGKESSH